MGGIGKVLAVVAVSCLAMFGATVVAGAKQPKPTTTTVAPKPRLFQQGTGTATTNSFKVKSNWDLAWNYDCSQVFGGRGNFIVSIYDDYGQDSTMDFDNQGINQLGASGSGVEHYHSGGNKKFLKVVSICPWTLVATNGNKK